MEWSQVLFIMSWYKPKNDLHLIKHTVSIKFLLLLITPTEYTDFDHHKELIRNKGRGRTKSLTISRNHVALFSWGENLS